MSIAYLSAYSGGFSNNATAATTIAVTVSAVPTGSTICVGVLFNTSGVSTSYSCADNAGNSYVPGPTLLNPSSTGQDLATFVCKSVTGSPTVITVTQAGGSPSAYSSITVDCFSGVLATTIIDGSAAQYQATPGTGTNAVTSGNLTVANTGDLIWSCVLAGAAGDVASPGTGFTAGLVVGAGNNSGYMNTEYILSGSSGTKAGTWTAAAAGYSFAAAFALQAASGVPYNPWPLWSPILAQ